MTAPTVTAARSLRYSVHQELSEILLVQSAEGPRVYRESELPREIPGIPFPYIVLGVVTEIPAGTYGQKGREQTMQIKSWGGDTDEILASDAADELDAQVVAKLDTRTFFINGHQLVRCSIERLQDFQDPSGKGHVVVSRLRTETLQQ